jgi:hypothetical protein
MFIDKRDGASFSDCVFSTLKPAGPDREHRAMRTRARRREASQIGDLFEGGCASQHSPYDIFDQPRMGKSAMFSGIRDPQVSREVFPSCGSPIWDRADAQAPACPINNVANRRCTIV